jgi:hypothetical protein
MTLASKRRFRQRGLQHDFSDSKLGNVYDELSHEIQGGSKSAKYYFFLNVLIGAFCLTLLVYGLGRLGGVEGVTSMRGSTILRKASVRSANESVPLQGGGNGTGVDISVPIIHEGKQFDNRKRVLALGGSTTFGANLESQKDTYPMILSELLGVHWKGVNLAVQATDASYASQCVESIVRDVARSVDDMVYDFDVILLEYSLSGLDGLYLLTRRLRRRYPNALVLYVHLWSLRTIIENTDNGVKPRTILAEQGHTDEANHQVNLLIQDRGTSWKYSADMIAESKQHSRAGYDAVQKVQGLLYEMPVPENPREAIDAGLFGPDYHHLSKNGHHFVAQEIYRLVNLPGDKFPMIESDPAINDHTWGQGDQCYSWFESGKSPHTRFIGGTMAIFAKSNKWALQVGEGFGHPATIAFENPKEVPQPVRLELMSWGPNTYPKVKVQLNSVDQKLDDSALLIEPLHLIEWQRAFHMPRSVHIGWVEPGKNSVTVDSIEVKKQPLRVTGIILCGACVEMDNVYTKIEAKTSDNSYSNGTPDQAQEKPAEAIGKRNVPAEGQNPAIEQLKKAPAQPNTVEHVESVNLQETVGEVGQAVTSVKEPNPATQSTPQPPPENVVVEQVDAGN